MTREEIIDTCKAICANPDKPVARRVSALVEDFYKLPSNGAGGMHLHCVLDDGNWEPVFIHHAVESATKAGDEAAFWLAKVLLRLSPSQRRRI